MDERARPLFQPVPPWLLRALWFPIVPGGMLLTVNLLKPMIAGLPLWAVVTVLLALLAGLSSFCWLFWAALAGLVRAVSRNSLRRRMDSLRADWDRLRAHLEAWRLLSLNQLEEARIAIAEADRFGPDPWPSILAITRLPPPGALTPAQWQKIAESLLHQDAFYKGVRDGITGALPPALAREMDKGSSLPELLRVGIETGYVKLPEPERRMVDQPSA